MCLCVGAAVMTRTLFQYRRFVLNVSYAIVSKWEMICRFTYNSITTIYVLIDSISSRCTFTLDVIYRQSVSQPASQLYWYQCYVFIICSFPFALALGTNTTEKHGQRTGMNEKPMKGDTNVSKEDATAMKIQRIVVVEE